MDVLSNILEKSAREAQKSITVNKHLDLEYDLGTLLAVDTNCVDVKCLKERKNDYLLNVTRDNVQLLFNKIWELPTQQLDESIVARLPPSKIILPRARPIPKPKPLTKWEQFAKLKGIQKTKKAKLSWDEQLSKWVPLYGYKRVIAEKERDWVLEVPATADPMEDQFLKRKSGKLQKVAKNELQRLRNIAKAKNIKVPRVGLTNPDVSSSKDLQAAITVTRSATASLGKFQNKLSKEKDARGINELIPASNRKRKLPTVTSDQERDTNLGIIDSVLNKRPKLNIEKAVARHINNKAIEKSKETENTTAKQQITKRKPLKAKRSGKNSVINKVQKKGKSGGKKRR